MKVSKRQIKYLPICFIFVTKHRKTEQTSCFSVLLCNVNNFEIRIKLFCVDSS